MINQGINDRAGGLLVLFTLLLLLYVLKPCVAPLTTTGGPCDGRIFIQISGDIRSPGVYMFPRRAGLKDLIETAGGLTSGTIPSGAFRNIIFSPGTRVLIRSDGNGFRFSQGEISAFHRLTLHIPISLNRESEEGLTAIPGIGPGLAGAIIRERAKRGGFKKIEDIRAVRGIGKGLYEKIRPYFNL